VKIGDYLIVWRSAVAVIPRTPLIPETRSSTTLEFCLVLDGSGYPFAMPTVLSVTMAVGARLRQEGSDCNALVGN